jgi:hypothetical protein
MNFSSLDELITAIKKDITDAERLLDKPELEKFKNDEFFKLVNGKIKNSCSDDSIASTNGQQKTTNGGHL